MSVPTVTAILPTSGHTGGKTLVEIQGTGFALRPAPAPAPMGPNAPLPDPAPSVAVTIGGEPCETVWVLSDTRLRALTPIHDPAGGSNVDSQGQPIPACDVVVQNLDVDGAPVGGESATLLNGYSFLRPDLSKPGLIARVIEAFVLELRRQVVEEVDYNPHTDWDPNTGDGYNLCQFAKIPALAIVDVKLPLADLSSEQTVVTLPNGDFIARRPPDVRNVVMTVVGVSDNEGELLTMEEVVTLMWRKNKLRVRRNPSDPSAGWLSYTVVAGRSSEIQFSGRQGRDNIVAWSLPVTIQQIARTDIPGLPSSTLPGVPASYPAEATLEYGRTADTIGLNVEPK